MPFTFKIMKLFPALLLGLAQFGDAHPHHQHRRHMQEQASPVVQGKLVDGLCLAIGPGQNFTYLWEN